MRNFLPKKACLVPPVHFCRRLCTMYIVCIFLIQIVVKRFQKIIPKSDTKLFIYDPSSCPLHFLASNERCSIDIFVYRFIVDCRTFIYRMIGKFTQTAIERIMLKIRLTLDKTRFTYSTICIETSCKYYLRAVFKIRETVIMPLVISQKFPPEAIFPA